MRRWMVVLMSGVLLSCQGPAAVMAREATAGDPAAERALPKRQPEPVTARNGKAWAFSRTVPAGLALDRTALGGS